MIGWESYLLHDANAVCRRYGGDDMELQNQLKLKVRVQDVSLGRISQELFAQ